MKSYKCKCGKTQIVSPKEPAPCEACHRCGSNLVNPGIEPSNPSQHEWMMQFDEDGNPWQVCQLCNIGLTALAAATWDDKIKD